MKRVLLSLSLIIIVFSGSVFGQEAQEGSYVYVGGFVPDYTYSTALSVDKSDIDKPDDNEQLFGLGPYFEFGNLFKVTELGPLDFHVKATWLDVNLSVLSYEEEPADIKKYAVQASTIKVGPNFTFGINDDMALDAYYQLAPTYSFIYDDSDYGSEILNDMIEREQHSIGLTHTAGFAFVYDKYTAGVNFNFGSVKNADIDDDVEIEDEDYIKYRMNSIRFFLGFRF